MRIGIVTTWTNRRVRNIEELLRALCYVRSTDSGSEVQQTLGAGAIKADDIPLFLRSVAYIVTWAPSVKNASHALKGPQDARARLDIAAAEHEVHCHHRSWICNMCCLRRQNRALAP